MNIVEGMLSHIDVGGRECLVVVGAVGDMIEHIQLLEIGAALEAVIRDDHLQSCPSAGGIAVAVGEDNLAYALVALQGRTVDGDGLVVVGDTDVVADVHHTLITVQSGVVNTAHREIPNVLVEFGTKQITGLQSTVICCPRTDDGFHLSTVLVAVISLSVFRAEVAVLHSVVFLVVHGEVVRLKLVLILTPALVGNKLRHDARRYADLEVGTVVKHSLTDGQLRGMDHFVVIGTLNGVHHHIKHLQISATLESLVANGNVERQIVLGG